MVVSQAVRLLSDQSKLYKSLKCLSTYLSMGYSWHSSHGRVYLELFLHFLHGFKHHLYEGLSINIPIETHILFCTYFVTMHVSWQCASESAYDNHSSQFMVRHICIRLDCVFMLN